MLGVRPSGLSLRGTPSVRITGAVRRDSNEVEEYTRTSTSRRTVPLDDYTAEAVGEWLDLKRRRLRGMGIRSVDGLLVVAELDAIKPYSSFINEWHKFIEKAGFDGTSPMRSGTPSPPSTSPTERTSRPSRSSSGTRPRRTPSISMSGTYRRQALSSRTATWAGSRWLPREPYSCRSRPFAQRCLVPRKLARYTFLSTNMCGVHTRASPSGKASASQADTRGFESRCPLQEFEGTSNGAFCMCGPRARTRTRWGREAEQTRERLPASVRGCEASEAADSRSEYASPVARSRIVEGASDGAFAIYGLRTLVRIRWGRSRKTTSFQHVIRVLPGTPPSALNKSPVGAPVQAASTRQALQ